MLKIVVFDGGYGGEIFADRLEEELPVADVIRVIDWRNADDFLRNPRTARRAAREALRPYLGRVDLIIFANFFLTATSLKYFQRKYQDQKFIGLKLPRFDLSNDRRSIILTTKALTHTVNYYNYYFRIKKFHQVDTFCLDSWVSLIDDGELGYATVYREIEKYRHRHDCNPNELILTCSNFVDAERQLRCAVGTSVKIQDGFGDTIEEAFRALKLRGGTGKKKK